MAFFVELLDGVPDADVEVGGILERPVGQVVALEVASHALDCASMMPLYFGFLVRAGWGRLRIWTKVAHKRI